MECVFCKIIKKEIKTDIIDEDKNTLTILDLAPGSDRGGHLLVIPKMHHEILTDLNDDEAKKLMIAVKRITKAMLKFGEGVNVLQNNGRVAGQAVNHVHVHIIPRFENDHIITEQWPMKQYQNDEQKRKVVNQIKSLL